MKSIFLILFFCVAASAQSPSPSAIPEMSPAPIVMVSEEPKAIEPPPEWLKTTIESVYSLPIVGPYAAKGVQWLGVFAVILTSLTGAAIVSIRALMTVLNFAGLVSAVAFLTKFENGKVMYWLRYFSMFNAQKK